MGQHVADIAGLGQTAGDAGGNRRVVFDKQQAHRRLSFVRSGRRTLTGAHRSRLAASLQICKLADIRWYCPRLVSQKRAETRRGPQTWNAPAHPKAEMKQILLATALILAPVGAFAAFEIT